MENSILKKFKERYNNVIDLSFKIYDVNILGHKAFDVDNESIASIMYNPATKFYECWRDESKLTSNNESMVINFLDLK